MIVHMNILILTNSLIPSLRYGGTQRVVYSLCRGLVRIGHAVTLLAAPGSSLPNVRVISRDKAIPLEDQIPEDIDVAHFHGVGVPEGFVKPYVVTMHGNTADPEIELDINTVFISRNHASMYGSDSFVFNGLDWNCYASPDLNAAREYFHFLGKAAWSKKNVKGAIAVARMAKQRLLVMGGTRLNLKMGFRFTPYPSISFAGMVDDQQKSVMMNRSKGLIFPVRWEEPFGLALTESLYFGCPVFGTPYGALSEIINEDVGFLSSSRDELAQAVMDSDRYSRIKCHEYARDCFGADAMAQGYLRQYETVLNGRTINRVAPHLLKRQSTKLLPFD